MYTWLVFSHIVAAFLFVLSHGASAAVSLALRKQRDPERVRALLELSGSILIAAFVSLVLVLGTGIWAGFEGGWWDERWIWASLGLLVVISAVMGALGTPYFDRVRDAVGMDSIHGGKRDPAKELATPEELEAVLRSPLPILVAVLGAAGLVAMLWLMTLKPF